jgi:hypothetical protein
VRARIEALNISRDCLDRVAGIARGHSGKLLAPSGEGKDPKRFGMVTLGPILGAAGLKLLVLDDQEALAKASRMFEQRDASQVRTGNQSRRNARKRRGKAQAQSAMDRPTREEEEAGEARQSARAVLGMTETAITRARAPESEKGKLRSVVTGE